MSYFFRSLELDLGLCKHLYSRDLINYSAKTVYLDALTNGVYFCILLTYLYCKE